MLERLASLRLTLAILAALAAGVAVYAAIEAASALWVSVPLLALAANLCAAIATRPAFRRNGPLLAFHLALLAVVALAAAGRLTYLKGQLELTQGEVFGGQLSAERAGPLHSGSLQQVRFVNDGFTIRYAPGLKRAETRNPVRVFEHDGRVRDLVIGDTEPLILEGYRFYTSHNKGFSLVFRWYPRTGAPERGTVNLPSYPIHEHRQALEWQLPAGGPTVWTQLHFDKPPLDASTESWFRTPDSHHVVVRLGEARWELRQGQQIRLDAGDLVYEGVTTWMGYQVFYDWTIPWMLAACLTAILALGWHFARQFSRQPWNA